jgi:hypothetical protein
MRPLKIAFQLCTMMLFTSVVLLPYAGMTQGKLNRTTPETIGHPVMTADGPEPVPRSPQPRALPTPSAVTA